MADHRNALRTAVRILKAVNSWTQPDRADVAELLGYAPDLQELPLNELAIEAVNRAMRNCANDRRGRGAGA